MERSISAADILKLVSVRLPFLRRRALKVSLLVEDLRRLRWMEPVWRGRGDAIPGDTIPGDIMPGDTAPGDTVPGDARPVGVTGGECGWLPARDFSSSDSLRPRTLRFDLG